MRRFLAMTAMILVAAGVSVAQDEKNEAAVTVGRTFISDRGVLGAPLPDSNVRSGKGLSFNLSYARALRNYKWGSLWFELPFLWNPDEDLHYGANQVPKQYSSMFLTPAARLRFFEGMAFQPWVSFGGGIGHFVASKDMVFFGPNTGHRIKTTGVLDAGVGLDVPLGHKFQNAIFRFEARDNWSGEAPINVDTGKSHQHNYYVGGGVVFKF